MLGIVGKNGSENMRRARVFSLGLRFHRVMKGLPDLLLSYGPSLGGQVPDVCIGWGRKPSGAAARRYASCHKADLMLVEDGFIRSGGREDPPISLVIDDRGIYYDANEASRLETLVKRPLDAARRSRAEQIRQAWVAECVSKYNAGRSLRVDLPDDYVLVVDQVAGDHSISYGRASELEFEAMLSAALRENPGSQIILKTHPDRSTRGRRGHFDLTKLARHPRVTVIVEPSHPVSLIRGAKSVYVVTSQMGFEALLHGRPVRCFGMPFYAGWGLTSDEMEAPVRRSKIDLEALVYAALVDYSVYVDPITGSSVQVEDAIAAMGAVRRLVERTPPVIHAVGFSPWKRPILRRFCRYSDIVFCTKSQIPAGATVALWSIADTNGLPENAAIIRIEDGFLRSRGLGADLVQPYSWCFDRSGMHFDPKHPSDLEKLLQADVGDYYVTRAKALRERITELGLSKYNLPGLAWKRTADDRVLLVAGQVEDDASIRAGSPRVRRNVDLLRAVRAAEPEARLIYKPHPDVTSGLRVADSDPEEIAKIADEIATDASTTDLLSQVDGVHVMTSQIGFEAILRKISVTCHGIPFYSGWGLTDECQPVMRRGRKLSIDELVAATLILYPSYSDPKSGLPMTPEQTIDLLSRDPGRSRGTSLKRGVRKLRVRLRQRGTKAQHDEDRESRTRQEA